MPQEVGHDRNRNSHFNGNRLCRIVGADVLDFAFVGLCAKPRASNPNHGGLYGGIIRARVCRAGSFSEDLGMTPQSATNEIGRLNRIIDDLRKDKIALHQDVIGQREVMDRAIEHITNRDNKAAKAALQNALDYRNMQREPRKNTLTSG
jgi:hypothetical protein